MKTVSQKISMLSVGAALLVGACDSVPSGTTGPGTPGVSAAIQTDANTTSTLVLENLKVCKTWSPASDIATTFNVTINNDTGAGGSQTTAPKVIDPALTTCKTVAQFNSNPVGVSDTDLLRVIETQPAGTELVSITAVSSVRNVGSETITVNASTPTASSSDGTGSTLNFATRTWQATQGDNNAGYVVTFVNRVIPTGGEGCTPGYWKNHAGIYSWSKGGQKKPSSWQVYSPTQLYNTVFGVTSSFGGTLIQALIRGGGGEAALGRHAVAALLNSVHSGVDYPLTSAQVIAIVQAAYTSGDFDGAKNQLAALNEQGCPLGTEDGGI